MRQDLNLCVKDSRFQGERVRPNYATHPYSRADSNSRSLGSEPSGVVPCPTRVHIYIREII